MFGQCAVKKWREYVARDPQLARAAIAAVTQSNAPKMPLPIWAAEQLPMEIVHNKIFSSLAS